DSRRAWGWGSCRGFPGSATRLGGGATIVASILRAGAGRGAALLTGGGVALGGGVLRGGGMLTIVRSAPDAADGGGATGLAGDCPGVGLGLGVATIVLSRPDCAP